MSRGGERSRTPEGRARGESEGTDDLEVPTDQGPSGPEDGELPPERQPSVSNVAPAMSAEGAASAQLLEEGELPRREAQPKNVHEGRRVAPDPEAGEIVGDYALEEKLGKGGAGSVFRARRRSDGSIVALKVLAASKAKRARIVQRFFDEVRAASAVKHPGLIRVLDFIEEEDPRRLAYAMEYVDGESLRDRLRRDGALDLREAIHIGAEVSDALAALHDAGIIHRDLKPENIMILRAAPGVMPRVKLLDFGVVKFLPVDKTSGQVSAAGEERPGTFVGTPRYMAPEQAAGGALDARADLFSVGVLLFEMITGVCPHEGDSLRDVVLAKLKGAPRITVNREKEILPQELTDVVDACLQLKPNLRPKDARQVARGLREASVVLFTVGPVKADESGVPFRPASQVVAHTSASLRGDAAPTPPEVIAELPRPELPIPIAHPVRPGPQITVRPVYSTTPPAGVAPTATPIASPVAPRAEARAGDGRMVRWIALVVVLSVVVVLLAFFAARAMRDDQVLLVPLEAPANDRAKDPKGAIDGVRSTPTPASSVETATHTSTAAVR